MNDEERLCWFAVIGFWTVILIALGATLLNVMGL